MDDSANAHPRAIETHALRKRFGATLAVADLSLQVGAGEIFGFLGPNGAGKNHFDQNAGAGRAHVRHRARAGRTARRSRGPRVGFFPSIFGFTTR